MKGEEDYWTYFFAEYLNVKIIELPFYKLEVYFYRLILEIINYKQYKIDPFELEKHYDLNLLTISYTEEHFKLLTIENSLKNLILNSLLGNSSDLSQLNDVYKESTLLINQIDALESAVNTTENIHIILDNAGRELFHDLLLALKISFSGKKVFLYFKKLPGFVSDAIEDDLSQLLAFLEKRSLSFDIEILKSKIINHEIQTVYSLFFNSPESYADIDNNLVKAEGSNLIILKGDLNYRKYFDDRKWKNSINPLTLKKKSKIPTYALRVVKSDLLVGLDDIPELNREMLMDIKNNIGKFSIIQKIR
jgi:hypothetical protein